MSTGTNTIAQESFGQWLQRRRKEYGYTQAELAQLVGCSLVMVRRIEEGVRRPSTQLAELIAVGLEIPPAEQEAFVRWARTEPLKSPVAGPSDTLVVPPGDTVDAGEAVAAPLETKASQPENPYKGLRAFQEGDALDFFGREALTARLVDRLSEPGELSHFLAVVGPSGSGKSSLVRAGLIPAVRRLGLPGGMRPTIAQMLPGSHPFEELEAALLRVAPNPPASLLEQLTSDERGLLRALKRTLPGPGEPASQLLLYVDQFEEAFTLSEDRESPMAFLRSLHTAVTEPASPLWLVIGLRADFFDRPLLYPLFYELMRQRTELVGPLNPEELYRAIVGPAERVGVQVEPSLTASIVREVDEQPGSLPLLEYSLTELFEQREGEGERRLLTAAAYRATGGLTGAVSRRADDIYCGLSPESQEETRQLFLRLVTLGEGMEDTRRRVRRAELASAARDEDALESVLEKFGRYRLLTFDRDVITRTPTVEIAHEALLKSWGRLREWLEESRADLQVHRQLTSAAAEWAAAERDPGLLASGTRLGQFETLAAGGALALTEEEQEYIAASLKERDKQEQKEKERQAGELELQRRAASRLRYLVVGLALFLVAAIVLSGFAVNRSTAADNSAQDANAQKALAQSAAATAEADQKVADTQRGLAVQSAATAQAEGQVAQASFTHAEAQRLADEAQNLLAKGGSAETIALLSIRSMNTQYTPQGDAAVAGASTLIYPRQRFIGHTDGLYGLAFSPDGKYVLTGSNDNTVRLWDIVTGKEVRRFIGHTKGLYAVTFSPDGKYVLTSGGNDDTARLWDAQTGAEIRRFVHPGGVRGVAFSPDGKYVLTGSIDKIARLWDVATGQEIREFTGHTGTVTAVAFSPDGKYVLTGSQDQTARLWDAATGKELRAFTGHTDQVWSVAYSPDGKYVLTGSDDETARIWDAQTGAEVRQLVGHTDTVLSVAYSPDGNYIITGSFDQTARLWDAHTGQELRRFMGQLGHINRVAYSPDGKYVLTGGDDHTALLWDAQSAPERPQFLGHTGAVNAAAYSPDGKYVLTGGNDHTVRLWDAQTGAEIRRFVGHTSELYSVAFSPDGKYVLTGSQDKTARLWDTATGNQLRSFDAKSSVEEVAFSPSGKYVLVGTAGGPLPDDNIQMWDVQAGVQLRHFSGQPRDVWGLAFSSDEKYVFGAGNNSLAHLWDAQTGALVRTFSRIPANGTGTLAVSLDGKSLYAQDLNGITHMWDVQTGAELRTFPGGGGFNNVAVSPDGKSVLGTGASSTARLWDVQTGTELRRFTGHTADVYAVAFSPDGKLVLTGSADGTARLWDADYHDTINYLCGKLLRDFTPDERAQFEIKDAQPTCPKP
jgi:WD40 repeat protein/transcriptional regulator with XRE-family HTH domain